MMSIGKLADRYGVSPESLRVWERLGLIPAAHRTVGGHRRYSMVHVRALDALMRAEVTA
jgi:DNA-binding transcriptional MerR regulator